MNKAKLIISALVLMLSGMGTSFAELDVVDRVDLERYEGRWYEIARLPNRFQRQCVSDVSAEYRLRDDGRVGVTNRCRRDDGDFAEASGVARLSDPDGPQGALEVRFAPAWLSFLPFVWGDYRILVLGPDYDHALIGSDNRRYLWVLSRADEMDDALLGRLLERARDQGFDTQNVILTRHEEH